jgi:tetratricopeptide (TPR) repeat protein
MKPPNASATIAVLMLATTSLAATTLSPACEATNRKALSVLADQHVAEAEAQLTQFVSQMNSTGDTLCLGVTLGSLTSVYERAGRLDLAEQSGTRAMNLLAQTVPSNSPAWRQPLLLLAKLAIERGQFSKATSLLSRVELLPEPTHADQALLEGLKAILLVEAGSLAQAESTYKRSIAERDLAGQGATKDIAPELCNLAVLYLKENRASEALPLLERALRIEDNSRYDPDAHVKTLFELAVAHSITKNSKEANCYFLRAIDLLDTLPPTLRPDIGRNVYLFYSSFLRETGRKREAKALDKAAYARFGPDPSAMTVGVNSLLAKGR